MEIPEARIRQHFLEILWPLDITNKKNDCDLSEYLWRNQLTSVIAVIERLRGKDLVFLLQQLLPVGLGRWADKGTKAFSLLFAVPVISAPMCGHFHMSSDVHLWMFTKDMYWKSITDSWKNQDGGIERLGTHLPQWTHQKFIQKWNNYHWKLTRHWQKYSCKTKTIIKIHMKSGRKRNEQDRLWVSGKELRLKGRSHRQSHSLRTEQFKTHIGSPSPTLWHKEGKPLDWLEGQWE